MSQRCIKEIAKTGILQQNIKKTVLGTIGAGREFLGGEMVPGKRHSGQSSGRLGTLRSG